MATYFKMVQTSCHTDGRTWSLLHNKILIEDEPIIKPKSFIGSSEQLKMFAQDLMNEKAINSLKNIQENHTIINRIPVEMIETSHDT